MPRISIDNYDTVASWNGSQDLFVVEQPDGTKVATPNLLKQFIEAGDFTATGEIEDGHGNTLQGVKDQIDDLSDDLVLEKFNVTLASAVGTPTLFDSNCFYNPKTKEVHIQILIWSLDALIPTSGNVIFTVPNKYKPAVTTQLGMALVMDNNSMTTQSERCFISNSGHFALNNFAYGTKATRLLNINADYISA